MKVKVDGIGLLEFPDGTDQKVIDKTVKGLVSEKKTGKQGFMQKYFPSIPDTYNIYEKEWRSGLGAMNTALEKPTGKNLLGGVLGALQYVGSPITAIGKGIVGNPTKNILKEVGVPEPVADFVGDMAETATYFIPYGKVVQQAIKGKEALAQTEQIAKIAKTLPPPLPKKALEFPEALSKNVVKDAIEPISLANKKILRENVIDDVTTTLKDVIVKGYNPSGSKRITQEIVDYMVQNPDEIIKVSEKYNLSPQQLAAQMKETMTLAGRDLGKMARLSKEIIAKFNTPYMKQLSKYMDEELADTVITDGFGTAFKTAENIRRSALVSQFVTTMRNIVSQGGRVALGSIDEAFQGAASAYLKSGGEGIMPSIKSTLRGLGEGLDLLTATIHRMSPKERIKLIELLDTKNALQAKATMFTSPIQDVVLTSRIAKTLNTLNTTQEYFFRNIAFEAKLRQLVKKGGFKLDDISSKDIPENIFNEAANYALDMTFAAMPKTPFAKEWVRAMSHPIMTAAINPFPRFLYGNALPFLKRFSPIGFLEAAKPSVVADIVSGHPEKFAKAISEATLGTIMLNTAGHIRNSKYGGENWYEIRVGDKTYDTRAYAPFSTYLFIAESLTNPERIKPADFGSALLSLNRIGGTGLVLADIMRGTSSVNTINTLKKFAGSYVAGFSTPMRTLKDIYSIIDEEEAILRDVKDDEFWGPTKRNIPLVSQTLPKARSPLRPGDIKTESPVFRQFTGLSYEIKNELEKEVDKIQLNYQVIYPRTGDAKGDRLVSEIMAPILELAFPILLKKTRYNQLDNATKRILLGTLFQDTKKHAKAEVMKANPELAVKIKIDAIPNNIKELLENKGIDLEEYNQFIKR